MHRYYLPLLIILVFTSCNNGNTKNQNKDATPATDTAVDLNKNLTDDTIFYGGPTFPVDSLLKAKILKTGTFHEDEVWEQASSEKWYGLFKSGHGFYLEETSIKTKRVHDAVLDELESEKSGWEVSTMQTDSNYLLIEALPYLQNRKVEHVLLNKTALLPGETVTFTFLGTGYKLFATGEKTKVQDAEFYNIRNYKLFITATKNGQSITQLLVAQPGFDDKMIEVLFAGDIDGDGTLDFIIDTSGHYNATSPTLYLSKPANKKEIVKPVGAHTSVGC